MKKSKLILTCIFSLLATVCLMVGITACTADKGGDAVVKSIRITKQPDKTSYYVWEHFDPTGMEVTANMNDGTSFVLSPDEYTYGPTDYLNTDSTIVVVFYKGMRAQTYISVVEKEIDIEGITPYVFEAENAEVHGISTAGSNNNFGVNCTNVGYNMPQGDNGAFSGDAIVYNARKKGNTYSIEFESDCEQLFKYEICLTARKDQFNQKFDSWVSIEINGYTGFSTGALISDNVDAPSYYNRRMVWLTLLAKQGMNRITMTILSDNCTFFDCFSIYPENGAVITDKTTATLVHDIPEDNILVKPSQTDFGVITTGCTKCRNGISEKIPALGSEEAQSFYTVEHRKVATATEDGLDVYSCTMSTGEAAGKVVAFEQVVAATGKTSFKMEAESADLTTLGGSEVSCKSIGFHTDASGGAVSYHNQDAVNITFRITSDKDCQADLFWTFYGDQNQYYVAEDIYTVFVNNQKVDYSGSVLLYSAAGELHRDWQTQNVGRISLKAGTNTITFTRLYGKVRLSFDYITLVSDAKLTNVCKNYVVSHDNIGWIYKELNGSDLYPTEWRAGALVKGCIDCDQCFLDERAQEHILPKLCAENVGEGMYSYEVLTDSTEEITGKGKYTYVLDGQVFEYEVVIPIKVPNMLHLEAEDGVFIVADGNELSESERANWIQTVNTVDGTATVVKSCHAGRVHGDTIRFILVVESACTVQMNFYVGERIKGGDCWDQRFVDMFNVQITNSTGTYMADISPEVMVITDRGNNNTQDPVYGEHVYHMACVSGIALAAGENVVDIIISVQEKSGKDVAGPLDYIEIYSKEAISRKED